jgi:hypothetical protein
MSSTFTGLSEFINNIKTLEQSNISDYKTLFLAQVLNVVTGEDIEQATLEGLIDTANATTNHQLIGAIRYKRQTADNNKYEDEMACIAYPADRSNVRLPVPGELVLIMSTQSDSGTPQRRVELYTNVVTGANIARYASDPKALTKLDRISKPEGFVSGLLNTITQEVANVRFQLRLEHKPFTFIKEGRTISTMREGDMIVEGRFGSGIRFTSTIQKESVWSDNQMTRMDTSADGDPFLILKNSKPLEPETAQPADGIPQLVDEDPNEDQSSIYITTTQNIPLVVGASSKMLTWAVEIERTTREGNKLLKYVDESARLQSFIEGEYDPNFRVSATADVVFPGEAFDDDPTNDKVFEGGANQPVPLTGPASTRQEQLVKAALEASFANGETKHKCARGTFNHANNYSLLVKGQSAIPGMNVAAGGNANGSGFHNHMAQIGYGKFIVSGITKATMISICEKGPLDSSNNHIPWNVGDAITYWASDGDPKASHVQYGHAQMYIGALTGKGNWTTDNKYNYGGSSFVYRSKSSTNWNCVIFRAPRA